MDQIAAEPAVAKKKKNQEEPVGLAHGGKREGAGRKLAYDAPKVIKSINVSPEFAEFLKTQNASKFLEDLARRSKVFKQWKAEQSN